MTDRKRAQSRSEANVGIDELRAEHAELKAQNVDLKAENVELKAENAAFKPGDTML